MLDGGYMGKNIQKRVIDITGIELMPGEPTVCLGNGGQCFECCCDECGYYFFVSPILIQKAKRKILLLVAVGRTILKFNTYRQKEDREWFTFSILFFDNR